MNRSVVLCAAILCAATTSCRRPSTEDARFVALGNRGLETWRQIDPEWATLLGDHRFDSRSTDRSRAGIARRVAFARAYLDSLRVLDERDLVLGNQIDRRLLMNALEADVYAVETLREQEWNPLFYDTGEAIRSLLERDFAPPRDRLLAVKARLEALPAALATAESSLTHPPRIQVEAAIQQNEGIVRVVRDDIEPLLALEPSLRADLAPARAAAIAALEGHGRWLQDDLLPRADGDFRLGEAKFRRKLAYALESDLTAEQILDNAKHDLDATQKEMVWLARTLQAAPADPAGATSAMSDRAVVRAVLDRLARERPTDDTIVQRVEASLAACTAFVRERDLVTVPDEPPQVIARPDHRCGVPVACCDATGPLERRQRTFCAVFPAPGGAACGREASFYGEGNDDLLQVLAIHEVMPGHYVQRMNANRYRGSTPARAMLPSGAFVEGWATYAEQIMMGEGYGGPELRLQQLKLRLHAIIDAMLDQGVHMRDMTERQAMALMIDEGFLAEDEAAATWRRACLTSTQLSTRYVGNLEINQMRDEYAARRGGLHFGGARVFHDRLLSFGALAPKYLRELMGFGPPGPWRMGRWRT